MLWSTLDRFPSGRKPTRAIRTTRRVDLRGPRRRTPPRSRKARNRALPHPARLLRTRTENPERDLLQRTETTSNRSATCSAPPPPNNPSRTTARATNTNTAPSAGHSLPSLQRLRRSAERPDGSSPHEYRAAPNRPHVLRALTFSSDPAAPITPPPRLGLLPNAPAHAREDTAPEERSRTTALLPRTTPLLRTGRARG